LAYNCKPDADGSITKGEATKKLILTTLGRALATLTVHWAGGGRKMEKGNREIAGRRIKTSSLLSDAEKQEIV
jgi:hypothetical protein